MSGGSASSGNTRASAASSPPTGRPDALATNTVLAHVGEGNLDALGIDVETACLAAVLLGRRHRDAAVARAQVVEDVAFADAGELEHLVDDFLRCRHENDVGILRRHLGADARGAGRENQGEK